MSTYGLDTRSPCTSTVRPSRKHGAESSRPERNWLDAVPETATRPPRTPAASMVRGSRSDPSRSTPRPVSARTRSPMGRARICGWPSITYRPEPSAAIGVTKRAVVPDWRTSSTTSRRQGAPALPVTVARWSMGSWSTAMPSMSRHPNIASVSSLSSTPSSLEVPSARAAQTSARFVKLFDPGTGTIALTGPPNGSMCRLSMRTLMSPPKARPTDGSRGQGDRPASDRTPTSPPRRRAHRHRPRSSG